MLESYDDILKLSWILCEIRMCVRAGDGVAFYELENLRAQRILEMLGSCAVFFALGPVSKPCLIDTGWMYGVCGWWFVCLACEWDDGT